MKATTKQVGVYIPEEKYNEWKQTGMKGSFVFLRGMEAIEIIKAGNEKDELIIKLGNSVTMLNKQLLDLQDHADKLERINKQLQEENLISRKKLINYPE